MTKTNENCRIVQLSRLLDLESTKANPLVTFPIYLLVFHEMYRFLSEKNRDLQNALFHAKSWRNGKKNVELYCDFRDRSKRIHQNWKHCLLNCQKQIFFCNEPKLKHRSLESM